MRVAAINLPHTLTRPQAAYDSALVFNLVGANGVVLACEVDKGNDGPFEAAARHDNKRALFAHRKTQVAIPAMWTDFHDQTYRLTTPIPGLNPGRDLACVFNHRTQTVYCSAHLPNGKNNPAKARRRLRAIKWGNYERKAAAKVARWHDAGWNVVLGGDLNDRRGMRLHPAQQTVAHAGLMWLIAVAAPGWRVTHGPGLGITRNKGDHPVVVADVEFVRD